MKITTHLAFRDIVKNKKRSIAIIMRNNNYNSSLYCYFCVSCKLSEIYSENRKR